MSNSGSSSTPVVSVSIPGSSPASTSSQSPQTSTPPPQTSTPRETSTSLQSSSTSVPPSTTSVSNLLPGATSSSTSFATSSSRSTPTPLESPSTFLSVSNGNTIVVTTIIRSTPTATGVVNTNTSNKGFFQNTGAVAGTFTVVGLVGLAILIFIVTAVIRRRRADRFDKDVALAAAEAAATAHNPEFDDDYGYGSNSHGVGGYGGYADTYQAPVQFPPTREVYGMSNVSPNTYGDPDNYSVGTSGGPGAAGIGAGALYRSKSGKDQLDPFNAYAAHQDPTVQQQQANLRYRNPGQDRGGGYDVARTQPQPDSGGIIRSKSIQSSNAAQSLASHYSTDPLTQDPPAQQPPIPESYLDHYRVGFDSENHQPQARPISTTSMADIYGGVVTEKQPPIPEKPGNAGELSNPFEGHSSGDRHSGSSNYSEGINPVFAHDDPRMSLRDDEDYGAGRRILKVANE